MRSLAAATVMALGVVVAPAAAQDNPVSDILAPVVDLLRQGVDNSGPGNAGDRENPLPPTAPPPPMASTTPAPAATPDPAPPAPPVAAPPARPSSPVALRYLVGRHLLRPAPGTVLGGLQPTLRWRGGPARVDLYNVQIFSATGAKVMSAFPASRTFRVPPKRLAPGRRYLWRVWPLTRKRGYTRRPLALSWFATPSRTVLTTPAR